MNLNRIFKEAEKLSMDKPVIARKAKARSGVVIRRSGVVVKDTIVRKVVKYPSVKKKIEKIDRKDISATCLDDFLNSSVRRVALGKFVFREREQLLTVLVSGYGVSTRSVELLSFNSLLIEFDKAKAEEAKRLETVNKSKKEYEERLGLWYESFELVSDTVSIENSEHYNLEPAPEKEEVVEEDGLALTVKQREEQAERWSLRKVELKKNMEEARLLELACKDFTGSEIDSILSGKVERMVDPLAVQLAAEREKRIAKFVSQGIEYTDAVQKVNQWEASL